MNNYKYKHKYKFILTFCIVVAILAIIRHAFDRQMPQDYASRPITIATNHEVHVATLPHDSLNHPHTPTPTDSSCKEDIETFTLKQLNVSSTDSAHPFLPEIYKPQTYVHSYSACFPDLNPVQLKAATSMGIEPVATREEALKYVENRKLVNITNSPFYVIDPLTHSIPYLIPECQDLLNTICINFIDSLKAKKMPLHIPIITSVLRTSKDIKKLQIHNVNSTTNSCHCYGTTVDITYNRFYPITGNNKESRKNIARYNAQMKKILAEVLLDLRMQGRCYVKYEQKQACFHLTIRPTNKQ